MALKVRLFFIFLLGLCVSAGAQETARVAGVLSGNRVKLKDGRIVRYIGVAIPDPAPPGWSARQVEQAALAANRELVDRKMVRLTFDSRKVDRTGALLAYVYQGDTFINAAMIESGYALVEVDPDNDRFTRYFQKLLRRAKKEESGLWANVPVSPRPAPGFPAASGQPPWQKSHPAGTIVFIQPGDKYFYHRGDPRIKPGARGILIEDARRKGYRPSSTR